MTDCPLPQPKQPRYKLQEAEQGIIVTIPYPKKAVKIQLLWHSLAVLLVLVLIVLPPPSSLYAFWVLVIISGILALGLPLLWFLSLLTREIIRVESQELHLELRGPLRRHHLGLHDLLHNQRPYPLHQVTNLRVLIDSSHPGVLHGMVHSQSCGPLLSWATRRTMATMGPTLAVDFEPVPGAVITERFAMGLDENEARMLWRVIAKRFPEIARNTPPGD